jgi:probable lipoprotein NlpC
MRSLTLHAGRPARLLITGLFVVALLGGCASSRPPASVASSPGSTALATERQLRAVVDEWYGTPYDFGGTGANGIDCSAFVQVLYRDVLGLPVPRTTKQQIQAGRVVSSGQTHQPGDLVFFRPQRKQRHVGVYLGDGEFAHASTSQGVMISHLQEPYWEDVYWMTRRLLPNPTAPASQPPATLPSSRRTGW